MRWLNFQGPVEQSPVFESYTEKARRVIFFARYEASQARVVSIEPEHILLGLLREDKELVRQVFDEPQALIKAIRDAIEERCLPGQGVDVSVDMPLSEAAKRVLNYAADESDRVQHPNITTGHLFLGVIRDEKSISGEILADCGVELERTRELVHNAQRFEPALASQIESVRVGRTGIHIDHFSGTFPFKSKYYQAPDGRMAYVDEGQGEPVVMLHGNPTWSYLYRKFIPPIASEHRAIAVDHLGFGRSDKPLNTLRLDDHVRNFTALALDLDLRNVTLVMQDWGGPIGLGFATRFPDRIRRLVVMNTWAFRIAAGTPLHPLLEQFRIPGIGEALVQGSNLFVEGFLPAGIHRRERINQVMMSAYRAPFPDFNSRSAVLAFPRDIPVGDDHPSAAVMGEIQDNLHRLRVPVLIIWGTQDIAIPPQLIQARWLRYFPEAEVHLLDTASHFLQEDEPDRIIDLMLDFLKRNPAGPGGASSLNPTAQQNRTPDG
jgi:haloalkane dehalogenase